MSEINESLEQKCRERAYALWEAAGAPEGRETEFWFKARDELDSAGDQKAGDEPRTRRGGPG